MISNNLKKKFKLRFFKIFRKFLEGSFNIFSNKFFNISLTKIKFIEFFLEREDFKYQFISGHSDTEFIIEKLNQEGFFIIKDFWSEEKCLNGINDIDELLINYPQYIQSKRKSDYRVCGAEKISNNINDFAKNKLLISLAQNYNKKKTKLGFTLAAKMPAKRNNKGSGEGWHRDGFFRQFKTILYLSDVSEDNGPFELILNSQKCQNLIKDIQTANLKYMQYRLSDSEVNKILRKSPERKKTILGKMGTLILVDTSTLHRGSPIKKGTRYALTNYYYTLNQINKDLYKKFKVIPKDIYTK